MRDESRHDQLLDELRLLLDALAGKAEEYLRGCGATAEADSGTGCGWCPLCAVVALLRGQRPELNDQLVGIVQALRQVLADQRPAESEEDSPEEPAAPKVQRIRVQRVDGRVLSEEKTGAVPRC
ncbi:hypothetical protein [Saccharopolyspora sp. 5N708]|uniref:hypothetical protein n=1 Tax=Saccharopolyspora sp. 5N708 TaxID=3457424 RepID=UPI003FD692DF